MYLDVRSIEAADAAELYLTAAPRAGADTHQQAEETFSGIREALLAAGARIFEERVFATEDAVQAISAIRSEVYGPLDDGVAPTRLAVPRGALGDLAGVQIHAVRAPQACGVLRCEGSACGRILRRDGTSYVSISGLSAAEAGSAPAQARAIFEKAECVLQQIGGNMLSVARTWLWLGDILSWYRDFNGVRTRFFIERGLMNGRPGENRLPASTGIGVKPAGAPVCALDLVAITGAQGSIQRLLALGNQNAASRYGSAFSRAAKAATPAGHVVYVSGTASIDAQGKTTHAGDVNGQIQATIDNVRAVLRDTHCTDTDVVQAVAYCKTPDIEETFRNGWCDLEWPCIVVIADICRDDLLFEIEATALPGARKR